MGAARRRGRHRHRRHARPETGRGCRRVDRPQSQQRAAAAGGRPAARPGRRRRHRRPPGRAHRSASEHHELRAELLSVDRIRSRRFPLAVHAGARERRTRSCGRGSASWSVRKQEGVQLASTRDSPLPVLQIAAPAKPFVELPDLKDCWAWATQSGCRPPAAIPPRWATRSTVRRSCRLSRLVCPRLSDAEHRLPRLRGADVRARSQGGPRACRSPTPTSPRRMRSRRRGR